MAGREGRDLLANLWKPRAPLLEKEPQAGRRACGVRRTEEAEGAAREYMGSRGGCAEEDREGAEWRRPLREAAGVRTARCGVIRLPVDCEASRHRRPPNGELTASSPLYCTALLVV